jgi:PRC-barrel domain
MTHRIQSIVGGGLACFLLLLGTSLAYSQSPVRRVSALIGSAVELQAGGKFGEIEDLIINDEGCIDFLVVVFEDKLIAIPFGVTRVDFGRRVVFIDVERELLLRAPSFARKQFPDLSSSSEFGRKVHSHFQTQGRREGTSKSRAPETRPTDKRPLEGGKQPEKRKPSEDRKHPEDKKPPEKP